MPLWSSYLHACTGYAPGMGLCIGRRHVPATPKASSPQIRPLNPIPHPRPQILDHESALVLGSIIHGSYESQAQGPTAEEGQLPLGGLGLSTPNLRGHRTPGTAGSAGPPSGAWHKPGCRRWPPNTAPGRAPARTRACETCWTTLASHRMLVLVCGVFCVACAVCVWCMACVWCGTCCACMLSGVRDRLCRLGAGTAELPGLTAADCCCEPGSAARAAWGCPTRPCSRAGT